MQMPRRSPELLVLVAAVSLLGEAVPSRPAAAAEGTEALSALMRAASVAPLRSVKTAPGAASSPRNASYRLKAVLDETNHRIRGEGTLTWRNLERQPVDKLVFHLYQNAFKNLASTFVFEAGARLRGDDMPERGFGAIDLSTLRVGGRDVLAQAEVDDTLLTVPLSTPLGPSATVEVQFTWSVQLPRIFARSGWAERYHAVTQWFPKIGIWDCGGGSCRWRARQYHGVTEFFADFGVYEVEIDVPRATQVGATGVLVSERSEGERRILRFLAEDVHDFAFFTDPEFIEVRETFDDGSGPLQLRLLTRRGQEAHTARHLAGVRAAVLEAAERVGPYPYSNLTVVVPPFAGNGSGGMEYPTLITVLSLPMPEGLHEQEETAAHEFGHQYFYHLFASDEVEEAWLDEGLNETFSGWVMERMFGRCSSVDLPWLCLSTIERNWLAYRATTQRSAISVPSFAVPRHDYGSITYDHSAVLLRTLEGLIGSDRMRAGFQRYAERARFRHPSRQDFVAALGEGARQDLGWFFDQGLDRARVVDYAVEDASSEPFELAAGFYDCPPKPLPASAGSELVTEAERAAYLDTLRASQQAACAGKGPGRHELLSSATEVKPTRYNSEVVVQRLGDFLLPVTVRAVFRDGSSEDAQWTLEQQQRTPEQRLHVLRFHRREQPLLYAEVDPDRRLHADVHRINNGLSVAPQPRPVLRLWLTCLGALSTLLDLVGG
jgi:hypothetical protein